MNKILTSFLILSIISAALIILLITSIPTANKDQISTIKHVEKILVYKSKRRMELLDRNADVLKTYKIALGARPKGHKTQEGDEKTPEGKYAIISRNPNSSFHKSLKISYPNKMDIDQAKKRGVSPGGMIMIHGLPNGLGWLGSLHRMYDTWTDGCIAVTNGEIEEIWNLAMDGTLIEIRP